MCVGWFEVCVLWCMVCVVLMERERKRKKERERERKREKERERERKREKEREEERMSENERERESKREQERESKREQEREQILFIVFYCVVLHVQYVLCLLVRHPHITYDYLHIKHLMTHARIYDSVVPAAIRDRGRVGYRCSINCTGSTTPVIKNLMHFSWSLTDGRPFHFGALGPLDVI